MEGSGSPASSRGANRMAGFLPFIAFRERQMVWELQAPDLFCLQTSVLPTFLLRTLILAAGEAARGGQDHVRLGWRKLYGPKGSSGSHYTVSVLLKTLGKPHCMMNHCGKNLLKVLHTTACHLACRGVRRERVLSS